MVFPQTRLTLIQRLASGGSEEDWGQFLSDYWGPICRFSLRWGVGTVDDAEDVASQTFEVLLEKRLLVRWVSHRAARLRTLLCEVVRNILANRHRVQAGRARLSRDVAEHVEESARAREEQADAFYAAWVEDLIQQAIESLATEYHRKNQADYVRVLYSRLCEQLTIAEVADALAITPSNVDYYFRHARDRLSTKLEELVRSQVRRYCPPEETEQEFAVEWQRLGDYLTEHGGLEPAIRRTYELSEAAQLKNRRRTGLTKASEHITSIMRSPPAPDGPGKAT
jgi:RNA polymerase sigma factor (sigma-70 family)